jgi:hypothetical protein
MASIYGELIRAQLHLSASDLTPVASGLIYLNTTSHQVKWYANAAWKTAVDLDTVQTLTNKTLTAAVLNSYSDLTESASPATPSAGFMRLYAKNDQKLYTKDFNGVENEVGSGSGGSGEKNYVTNPSADSAITGWVSSAAGLTVTRTATASELPREYTTGTGIKIVAPVGDPINVYVYYDFTLDDIDLNKKLKIQWSQKQFGTYVASDFEVYIADQSAPGTILHTPDVTLVPAYDGVFTASFDTTSTATLSLVIRARVDMATDAGLVISDVIVGPGSIQAVPAIGPWVDAGAVDVWNDDAFAGGENIILSKGSTAYDKLVWRRVGSSMEIRYNLRMTGSGDFGDGRNYIKIPEGLTADLTKLNTSSIFTTSSSAVIGKATIKYSGGFFQGHTYIHSEGSGTRIGAALAHSASTTNSYNDWGGSLATFDAAQEVSLLATIPIAEWAGAPNYAGRNEVEYAYNTSGTTAAGGSDTTAFGYGPVGAVIGAIASATTTASFTTMRVRFQTPIQDSDMIFIEFKDTDGMWTEASALGYQYSLANTARYGVILDKVSGNTTDVDVLFGNAGARTAGATYGVAGQTWTSAAGAQSWRVVKAKSGQAVGFGAATSTASGLASPSGNLLNTHINSAAAIEGSKLQAASTSNVGTVSFEAESSTANNQWYWASTIGTPTEASGGATATLRISRTGKTVSISVGAWQDAPTTTYAWMWVQLPVTWAYPASFDREMPVKLHNGSAQEIGNIIVTTTGKLGIYRLTSTFSASASSGLLSNVVITYNVL